MKNKYFKCFLFLFPFILWMGIFRDFIFGDIAINIDTHSNYAVIKFFYNNLRNGVFPLWDPFVSVGRPYIFMISSGILNPILNMMMLLTWLGVSDYSAYMGYLVCYFYIGVLGFYFLSKQIFKDKENAYWAYILLMFSGLGASIFNQVNMLLIYVPAVWFFYFLLRWYEQKNKASVIGMTFSLMIVFSSYLPFYFIALFLIFMLSLGLLFPRKFMSCIFLWCFYCKQHWKLILLCALAIIISMLPLAVYKWQDSVQESVSPSRHCNYEDAQGCFQKTFYGSAAMSYPETVDGHLGMRLDFKHLFTHLNKVSYAHDGLFYFPFWGYLILALAAWTCVQKRLIFLCLITFFLFLLAFASGSWIHKLFFDAIFFFRYFRNLFFLMSYLMPLSILIIIQQFNALQKQNKEIQVDRKKVITLISIVHFSFVVFLWLLKNIIISSYITVLISWILSIIFIVKKEVSFKRYLYLCLFVLILIQPLEVFSHYAENAKPYTCQIPSTHVHPKFSYTRPKQDQQTNCKIFQEVPEYIDTWHSMQMLDSSGNIWFSGNTSRWIFLLFMKMENFQEYVNHKFILYDHVASLDNLDILERVKKLKVAYEKNVNMAFIKGEVPRVFQQQEKNQTSQPFIVEQPSEHFRVLSFSPNLIKIYTFFDKPKFLVYNDSFNRFWRVWINGQENTLYRANIAFKGILLPPGENIVLLKYRPFSGGIFYLFIMIFNFGTLGVLLSCLKKENKKEYVE